MFKKSRLYNGLASILLLTLSSACSLLVSPVVSATSIYDGLRITQNAVLQRPTCNNKDLSTSWFNTAVSYFNANSQQVYASSLSTFVDDNHYWGVFMQKADSNNTRNLVFFSHKKTDTLDYYTLAKDDWQNASTYQDQILYIPVDWSNYGADTFTTFTLDLDSNCNVRGQKDAGADFVSGTEAGGGFGMRVNDLWSNLYPDGWTTLQNSMFFLNMPFVEPSGYEGENVRGNEDVDGDGLSLARELTQGTSDAANHEDTDGDGLNDFTESQWNPDRDDLFCGSQCAYPNPTRRDIYVETDWMNDGTNDYKLTSTQIGLVQDAFEEKDINIHFDTGQYGGGNELPTYIEALKFVPTENETDFFNFKNGDETYSANFTEEKRTIWHYMITGNKLYDDEDNTTSGISYAGDDDAFIAFGQVAATHPLNQDQAIAGTVIHELGHNLCLTNTDPTKTYQGQDPACAFSGIDTEAGNDYVSAMNYNKQFSLVDYSEGLNGQNDHDDWTAVLLGMNDFVTLGADPQEPSLRARNGFDKTPIFD